MSLEEFYYVSQIVSTIAILVSLLFVGAQLQQTNRNQKALMQQGRSARTVAAILQAGDAAVSEAMARALAGDTSLSAAQVFTVNVNAHAMFGNIEDTFLQHRAGLLDNAGWETDRATLRTALSTPLYRVAWQMHRTRFDTVYREFVDDLLGSLGPARPYDERAIWQHLMQKELGAVETNPRATDDGSGVC